MAESIEKILEAYRSINADVSQTWRAPARYAQEPDLLQNKEQYVRTRFLESVEDVHITIWPNIRKSASADPEPVGNLAQLINMIMDPSRKDKDKMSRELIYSTENGRRPQGDVAYEDWCGFQIIDMDIKDKSIALQLKQHIFNKLQNCNWFLGTVLSSSGAGIHVYTKIKVQETDPTKKRLLFHANFRHKYSYVYLACLDAVIDLGLTKEDLQHWLDAAMMKPAQGGFIPYDKRPYINTRFFEDDMYVCFDSLYDDNGQLVDWISNPDLKNIFNKESFFLETKVDERSIVNIQNTGRIVVDGKYHDKVHYKHGARWRIANTLVHIFANESDPVQAAATAMRQICSDKISSQEILGDCRTAFRYKKPVDADAVKLLNTKHGYNIETDKPVISDDEISESIINASKYAQNPNTLITAQHYTEFKIKCTQYLGMIKDDVIDSLGKITLLEAGPGLGKTEMVKKLSERKKVMLVLPFTSIIKSKIERDENWTYSYASKKPQLYANKSCALTIDKFSRLNPMDIKLAGFEYIFIDESHLIFMSEYRPIMARVIDIVRKLEVPTVMMTGTPTGELAFFPGVKHIKIIKEELRKKEVDLRLVNNPSCLIFHACRDMAEAINNGKRILLPSNEGTQFSKRIHAGITYFLREQYNWTDELILNYYKKSNNGDPFMDEVNLNKVVGDSHVTMCTTYMGCGVDIEDTNKFEIYFLDLCTAAECDQWCNRLRNKNLHVKVYVATRDADGNDRQLNKFRKLNFALDDEEIMQVHSILRICNEMIERNPIEYKYNSMVASIVNNNRYIVYDEKEGRYHIDEIAFKTVMFERKYRLYAEQLPVFVSGMRYYGYEVNTHNLGEFNIEGSLVFQDLKNACKAAVDDEVALTTLHVSELLDMCTEDNLQYFKEIMNGSWEIKKGKQWKIDQDQKIITLKSVEVFEKVVPIVLSMYKDRYDIPTIISMFEYCRTSTKYNFAALRRLKMLLKLDNTNKQLKLDRPISDLMSWSRSIAEQKTINKFELSHLFAMKAQEFAVIMSANGVQIDKSNLSLKWLEQHVEKLFKVLIRCGRPDKNNMISMEPIEIIWEQQEEWLANKNDKIYLGDFIQNIINIQNVKFKTK